MKDKLCIYAYWEPFQNSYKLVFWNLLFDLSLCDNYYNDDTRQFVDIKAFIFFIQMCDQNNIIDYQYEHISLDRHTYWIAGVLK